MYSAFSFAWDSYLIIYKGKNSTPECVVERWQCCSLPAKSECTDGFTVCEEYFIMEGIGSFFHAILLLLFCNQCPTSFSKCITSMSTQPLVSYA